MLPSGKLQVLATVLAFVLWAKVTKLNVAPLHVIVLAVVPSKVTVPPLCVNVLPLFMVKAPAAIMIGGATSTAGEFKLKVLFISRLVRAPKFTVPLPLTVNREVVKVLNPETVAPELSVNVCAVNVSDPLPDIPPLTVSARANVRSVPKLTVQPAAIVLALLESVMLTVLKGAVPVQVIVPVVPSRVSTPLL